LALSDVTARPVGTLGIGTAVALDGNEVTGAPEGYGLGNAVTVTVLVVVCVTLKVLHS
jgi:hypothetical protein